MVIFVLFLMKGIILVAPSYERVIFKFDKDWTNPVMYLTCNNLVKALVAAVEFIEDASLYTVRFHEFYVC